MGTVSSQDALTSQQVLTQQLSNPTSKKIKKTKRIKVADRYQWRCYWCKCGLRREHGYQNSATIEHLVPASQGGPNSVWNLAAACYRCNSARGAMPVEEFALLAKTFSIDKRGIKEAANARKKAQRREAQNAAVIQKTQRLIPKQTFWQRAVVYAVAVSFTVAATLNWIGTMV